MGQSPLQLHSVTKDMIGGLAYRPQNDICDPTTAFYQPGTSPKLIALW